MSEKGFEDLKREYANTFRMAYAKKDVGDVMQIDFGKFVSNDVDVDVDIKASIDLPMESVRDLLIRIIMISQQYEKETGKDILGISK